jgi:hypothetical protein
MGANLGVGDGLAVAVGVAETVPVGVGVGVVVVVAVGVAVAVAVGVAVGVGEPDCAQYLPPVLNLIGSPGVPPQIIISLPVHTAVCSDRAEGASVVVVAVQLSLSGVYRPPVLISLGVSTPPQIIISLLVHTVV